MTILAAVLVAALVASNYLWIRELRKQRSDAWAREQNLLNRISHPEVFQPVMAEVPEAETEPEGPAAKPCGGKGTKRAEVITQRR